MIDTLICIDFFLRSFAKREREREKKDALAGERISRVRKSHAIEVARVLPMDERRISRVRCFNIPKQKKKNQHAAGTSAYRATMNVFFFRLSCFPHHLLASFPRGHSDETDSIRSYSPGRQTVRTRKTHVNGSVLLGTAATAVVSVPPEVYFRLSRAAQ